MKWKIDEEKVKRERDLDGCYIVRTDVAGYKSPGDVERAFRSLKTAHLEIRPIYHKTDERIKAHVFMCMLAYHLEWHLTQRLRPLFVRGLPPAAGAASV